MKTTILRHSSSPGSSETITIIEAKATFAVSTLIERPNITPLTITRCHFLHLLQPYLKKLQDMGYQTIETREIEEDSRPLRLLPLLRRTV